MNSLMATEETVVALAMPPPGTNGHHFAKLYRIQRTKLTQYYYRQECNLKSNAP